MCMLSYQLDGLTLSKRSRHLKQTRRDKCARMVCWPNERSRWAEKGSKRYLWNERSVSRATNYVLFGQGDELPRFDED